MADVSPRTYPKWFLDLLESVTDARPRRVIALIRENGYVTTEQLQAIGYEHPPRAVRDVRERGIPVITTKTKNAAGKSIALYKFPDDIPEEQSFTLLAGRKQFPRTFRNDLIIRDGEKCAICAAQLPARSLQIDHKVPYEIGGDTNDLNDHMMLCSSCNRSKSWTCEHCSNWTERIVEVCQTCYWAYPNSYSHVATVQQRRADITWMGNEVKQYELLTEAAKRAGMSVSEYLKYLYN